jgi:hypothetical protein
LLGLLVAGSATVAFAVGIRSGPIGVARAYAISNTIICYPVLLMGHRACGLEIKKTVAACAPLLLCALLMGGIVYVSGLAAAAAGMGLHARLFLKIAVGIVSYAACLRQLARSTYSEILDYASL